MKTILITGSSSGFGLQMVGDLLASGHRVIATLRKAEQRMELFSGLSQQYGDSLIVKNLDVTNAEDRAAIKEFIASELNSQLDFLINNAGLGYFGALEDFTVDQLRDQMELNFFAPALLTREHLPFLRASKGGVINITSIMGQYSMPLGSIYSASKYALEGLTEGLFYELKAHGVSVTAIAPGGHRTSFFDSITWAKNAHEEASAYSAQTKSLTKMMNKLSSRKSAPGANSVSECIVDLVQRKVKGGNLPREIVIGKDAWLSVIMKKILPLRLYYALMNKSYKMILKC